MRWLVAVKSNDLEHASDDGEDTYHTFPRERSGQESYNKKEPKPEMLCPYAAFFSFAVNELTAYTYEVQNSTGRKTETDIAECPEDVIYELEKKDPVTSETYKKKNDFNDGKSTYNVTDDL